MIIKLVSEMWFFSWEKRRI